MSNDPIVGIDTSDMPGKRRRNINITNSRRAAGDTGVFKNEVFDQQHLCFSEHPIFVGPGGFELLDFATHYAVRPARRVLDPLWYAVLQMGISVGSWVMRNEIFQCFKVLVPLDAGAVWHTQLQEAIAGEFRLGHVVVLDVRSR